jgi:hypothetical protein
MERCSVSVSTPRSSPIHLHQCYRYVVLYTPLRPNTDLFLIPRFGSYDSTILIAEATVPAIYQQSFGAVDPTNSGETSVNSLSRVLSTSSLPAAKVDKVCHTPTPSHCSFSFSHSHAIVFLCLPITTTLIRSIDMSLLLFIFTGVTTSRSLTS